MAKGSFSKVIDREATKVPYTFGTVCWQKYAISLELLSHSWKGLYNGISYHAAYK